MIAMSVCIDEAPMNSRPDMGLASGSMREWLTALNTGGAR
jgi:hypothetical protein